MGAMSREEYLSRAREFASRGESRPNARLNPSLVKYIRSNPKGKTLRSLAKELGVHYRTVEKVHYYETWAHVQ